MIANYDVQNRTTAPTQKQNLEEAVRSGVEGSKTPEQSSQAMHEHDPVSVHQGDKTIRENFDSTSLTLCVSQHLSHTHKLLELFHGVFLTLPCRRRTTWWAVEAGGERKTAREEKKISTTESQYLNNSKETGKNNVEWKKRRRKKKRRNAQKKNMKTFLRRQSTKSLKVGWNYKWVQLGATILMFAFPFSLNYIFQKATDALTIFENIATPVDLISEPYRKCTLSEGYSTLLHLPFKKSVMLSLPLLCYVCDCKNTAHTCARTPINSGREEPFGEFSLQFPVLTI